MAKTFKNGVSLHQLLETAPLEALISFLAAADSGKYKTLFESVDWMTATDDDSTKQIRGQLFDIAHELINDIATPLERHAQRILTLSEGRGVEPITIIAAKLTDPDERASFSVARNDVGRSLWFYQHKPALFDEAESIYYADHYRNVGRMYEAYEVASDAVIEFVWDDCVKQALEQQVAEKLELSGRCSISHLQISKTGKDGHEHIQHLVIVRHGGPLSSVSEFHEDDGSSSERYYRPRNEATLLFSPETKVIEVFSASASVRQQVAAVFAEQGLKMDISGKPLTLKQYNLSRFLNALTLETPSVEGFDIEDAVIVEIDIRPDNYKHKVCLKVTYKDDIEAVAEHLFGKDHIFSRATSISKVVILVHYTQQGERKQKTLNITLSEPNRCNLGSNKDPVQRELGYAMLTQWQVLQEMKPLSVQDEMDLFPMLVKLFDQAVKEVPGRFFEQRALDTTSLQSSGFIERRGRYPALLVDDGALGQEVSLKSSGQAGYLVYEDPMTGQEVSIASSFADKYVIKRDWLDEIVHKRFKPYLQESAMVKLDEHLTYLGKIVLANDTVPCYLTRNLSDLRTLSNIDLLLRARGDLGIGLVFSAGNQAPAHLAANVVIPILDYLSADATQVFDIDRLSSQFIQGKQLARGGMVVELVKQSNYSATLYIPGKAPLSLSGVKAISFFESLVNAYHSGSPVVPTKQLLSDAGSDASSPRQLFGQKIWESIEGVYVGFPLGVKRGAYQLLT